MTGSQAGSFAHENELFMVSWGLVIHTIEPGKMISPFGIPQVEPFAHILLKGLRMNIMTSHGFLGTRFEIWFENQIFGSETTAQLIRRAGKFDTLNPASPQSVLWQPCGPRNLL